MCYYRLLIFACTVRISVRNLLKLQVSVDEDKSSGPTSSHSFLPPQTVTLKGMDGLPSVILQQYDAVQCTSVIISQKSIQDAVGDTKA